MRKNKDEGPLSIYAKMEEAHLDPEGNIILILKKDRKKTATETVRRLRRDWAGKNVHIVVGDLL